MKQPKAGHVMTADIVGVREGTPFKDVVALFARHRISGLPVVDDDDKVLEVVAETDLMLRQVSRLDGTGRRLPALSPTARRNAARARARTAGQPMSTPAITVRAGETVAVPARTMAEHHVNRLPVVDEEDRLVGIVTRGDLLQVFLRPDPGIRAEIVDEAVVRALWPAPRAIGVSVHNGVVTLGGRVERRSEVPPAEALTRRVDGVVAVVNRLTYRLDDTCGRPVDATAHGVADDRLRTV
ncbi:CBS domain-containing protein [Streptomyces sp. PA03-1a]|nr:CBS domain-containing protein [Streptomyces sp. PA03-1a]MDX2815538.1 CBS domain-containing protein [Streptomyces sp. PA03-5A]